MAEMTLDEAVAGIDKDIENVRLCLEDLTKALAMANHNLDIVTRNQQWLKDSIKEFFESKNMVQ